MHYFKLQICSVLVLLLTLCASLDASEYHDGIRFDVVDDAGRVLDANAVLSGRIRIRSTIVGLRGQMAQFYFNMVPVATEEPGGAHGHAMVDSDTWVRHFQIDTRDVYDGESLISAHVHPHNHPGHPRGVDFAVGVLPITTANALPAPGGDTALPQLQLAPGSVRVSNSSLYGPVVASLQPLMVDDGLPEPTRVGRTRRSQLIDGFGIQIIPHLGTSVLGRFRWEDFAPGTAADESLVTTSVLQPFLANQARSGRIVYFFADRVGRANYAFQHIQLPARSSSHPVPADQLVTAEILHLHQGAEIIIPDGGSHPVRVRVSNLDSEPNSVTRATSRVTLWVGNMVVDKVSVTDLRAALPAGAGSMDITLQIPAHLIQRMQELRRGGPHSTAFAVWCDVGRRANVSASDHIHLASIRTASHPHLDLATPPINPLNVIAAASVLQADDPARVHFSANASRQEAPSTAPVINREQRVIRYDFDGVVGTMVPDQAVYDGGPHLGRLQGHASVTDGLFGQALRCTGQAGSGVLVADSNQVNLRAYARRTLSFWFRTSNLTQQRAVLYAEGAGDAGLCVALSGDRIEVLGGNGPDSAWSSSRVAGSIVANHWHHLVVQIAANADASTPVAGAMRVYLDAQIVGAAAGAELLPHAGGVRIGYGTHNLLGGSATAFEGVIDEFQIINRVLHASEIDMLAQRQASVGSFDYVWQFGDGRGADGQTSDHSYAETGTYDAVVIASDGNYFTQAALQLRFGSQQRVIACSGAMRFLQRGITSWQQLDFGHRFEDPIVFAKMQTRNGGQPAVIRVSDVTATGCRVQMREWAYLDGNHAEETIAWLVVERGDWQLPDGSRLFADRHMVNATRQMYAFNHMGGFASQPVVLTQIQQVSNNTPFTVRLKSPTVSGSTMFVQSEEALPNPSVAMPVGVLLRSVGHFASGSAGLTADTHTHAWKTIHSGWANAPAEHLVFAAMQTCDGGDTATIRLRNAGNGRVDASVEEEASRDSEVLHTTERIGWWMFTGGQLAGIPANSNG